MGLSVFHEITYLKDLQKYCDECTTLLSSVFKSIVSEYKDGFASSEFLLLLARTLDLILVVDVLKNAKASLNNDFSIYKRFHRQSGLMIVEYRQI